MTGGERLALGRAYDLLKDAVERGVFAATVETWRRDQEAELFPLDLPGKIVSPPIMDEHKVEELIAMTKAGSADAYDMLHTAGGALDIWCPDVPPPPSMQNLPDERPQPKRGRKVFTHTERNRVIAEAILVLRDHPTVNMGFVPTRGCSIVSRLLAAEGVYMDAGAIRAVWNHRT